MDLDAAKKHNSKLSFTYVIRRMGFKMITISTEGERGFGMMTSSSENNLSVEGFLKMIA